MPDAERSAVEQYLTKELGAAHSKILALSIKIESMAEAHSREMIDMTLHYQPEKISLRKTGGALIGCSKCDRQMVYIDDLDRPSVNCQILVCPTCQNLQLRKAEVALERLVEMDKAELERINNALGILKQRRENRP